MNAAQSKAGGGRRAAFVFGGLMTALCVVPPVAAAGTGPYPSMAALRLYTMARADEIALAQSAAPASIAKHAEVLVLDAHGYETAVKGTNGFVCFVGRSWDLAFDSPEFWNPRIRSPQCMNAVSVRSVLPRYLKRTESVLAGVSKADMQKRETAEFAAGTLRAPEPGAMSFMMSKGGYLNDGVRGPWHPHVMFFAPRTAGSQWGADLPGSPIVTDSVNYAKTTIVVVVVPNWPDGTTAPAMHPASSRMPGTTYQMMAQETSEPHTPAAVIADDSDWLRAEETGDTHYLDGLLLPEYRSVNLDGTWQDKARILRGAATQASNPSFASKVRAWKATHPSLISVAISGDVAIVRFALDKGPNPKRIMSCDIFVYRDGHWRALYSQDTEAGR